ncbi:MAG TPA: hypothetical protein VJI96_02635 [Candidatus Andersenbacteria bacterium]|nr:hypothetical protein [Candidatus Andersenbacteria bacterium]
MKTIEVIDFLVVLEGMSAVVRGRFLVFDFAGEKSLFAALPVGQYGMEKVPAESITKSHVHDFVSAYKSSGLDVLDHGTRHELPSEALVIVLPGVSHSWIPKSEVGGEVGSCDERHERQQLEAAA